ncbi:MAG: small multi-drug export protein [Firmicutes bacterium]|nr:small multi-drug export protein [Bacillota bacterium]MCR4709972.1 small multi-drug export protein [Clostridiales bacterium]
MLYTFFISMVPVIELRGGIPAGVAAGLPVFWAALVALAGNMLPVPFVLLFFRKVIFWMEKKSAFLNKLAGKMKRKVDANKDKVLKYEFWGLVLLVAIPLPGTGAYTGAMVAAMVDMQLKRAVPAILIGVIIAAIIVSFATAGVVAIS